MVIIVFGLIIAADILIPLVMAILLAFMLKPVCDLFEGLFKRRIISILLTLVVFFVPIGGLFWFFCGQLQLVLNELPDILRGLNEGIQEIAYSVSDSFNLNRSETNQWVQRAIDSTLEKPYSIFSTSLSASSGVLTNIFLTITYLFLILLYRTAFKNFTLQQFSPETRERGSHFLYEVQQVSRFYFGGMLKVMLILGVLNSTGLYLIGIDFPLLWGFLAATLAIIPYIGTFLGGLLPFMYSFASGDGYWQPVAIAAMYMLIQSLEGNFITPKVVGKSVNLNPLVAILALFIGEAIWGLAGMIVALPLLAILRIAFDHLENWRPVALLLSDELYDTSHRFREEFDHPKYRLSSLFVRQLFLDQPNNQDEEENE